MFTILVIKKMKIKTTLKYHCITFKITNKQNNYKKTTHDNCECWQGTEQLELSCIENEK